MMPFIWIILHWCWASGNIIGSFVIPHPYKWLWCLLQHFPCLHRSRLELNLSTKELLAQLSPNHASQQPQPCGSAMLSQLFPPSAAYSIQCTSSPQSTNTSTSSTSSLDEASWTLTKPGLWEAIAIIFPPLSLHLRPTLDQDPSFGGSRTTSMGPPLGLPPAQQ